MRMLAQVVVQLALLQLKVPGKYRTKLLFNVSHVFIRTLYNQYIYIYIYIQYTVQYSSHLYSYSVFASGSSFAVQ